MHKWICDKCGNEVDEERLRYICFYDGDGNPVHRQMEICPICIEGAYNAIRP